MFYPKSKSNLDNIYVESIHIDNYPSLINSKQNYYNKINHEQSEYEYEINDNLYNKLNSFHYSQKKYNLCRNRNNYPLKLIKNSSYNDNHYTNPNLKSIKSYSFWENNLSNLSLNKYKRMREKSNYKTIPNDMGTYKNKYVVENNNSTNNSIYKKNIVKRINDYHANKNEENIDYNDINNNKAKKNKNIKNRIKLNKEIANFNILEKKINKEIEKNNKNKTLKTHQKNYDTHNIINYNNHEFKDKKNNLINEFLLNSIKISNINSNKKIKRKKENEDDDINSQKKLMKRNITFSYNDNEKTENINYNFIKYLKNDNQKLNHINIIYRQLIDTFFYFINQLSKKYSFNGNIKDISYYLSNPNYLSIILIDLEQHLNKIIKSYEINQKNYDKIYKSKIIEKNKESDNDEELLAKSKFITIDIEKEKKDKTIEKSLNSIYLYNSKELSQKNKSAMVAKKFVNKTLNNNSLNYLNSISEKNSIKNNKIINKIIKVRKKNGKLMNKLNLGALSPTKLILNNKNNIRKNKINNNEFKILNLKYSQKNDLKSIINPKFNKEENYK